MKARGAVFIVFSAISFALSAVFAKYVHLTESIPASEVTFFRFFIGFILTSVYMGVYRRGPAAKKFRFVFLRAVTNTFAILLFYAGIALTTVSKANLLNMTFPVFVVLFAPLINRESPERGLFVKLAIASLGMYLVISPDFHTVNTGDLLSLASGVLAGISINFLREAGKTDSSIIILFHLMAIGLAINTVIVIPVFQIPGVRAGVFLCLSGLTGYFGQIFSTLGYSLIEASKGSLLSISRILFSIVLGVAFFDDPITIKIIFGALLVMASLTGLDGARLILSLIRPVVRRAGKKY